MKNPLAWYGAARKSMLAANIIRTIIEHDVPAENEGQEAGYFPNVFKSRSGDIFWLQTLRAQIAIDVAEDYLVGNDVNILAEETIDKNGIMMMPVPRYRVAHHLYPTYLYFVGTAMENVLKAIYVLRHTDSIYSDSDPKIVKKTTDWSHRLVDLASTDSEGLQLELSEREAQLLDMLRAIIEWVAKYPGPKDPKQLTRFVRGEKFPNPFSVKERGNYPKFETTIHDFYKRLMNILIQTALR
jgi:hypothetical protein